MGAKDRDRRRDLCPGRVKRAGDRQSLVAKLQSALLPAGLLRYPETCPISPGPSCLSAVASPPWNEAPESPQLPRRDRFQSRHQTCPVIGGGNTATKDAKT